MARARGDSTGGRFPRVARVNSLLKEVIAEQLERLADNDDRLLLVTVTAVDVDPDLRKARVYLAELGADSRMSLESHRGAIQAAIAKQVRLSRTPTLEFQADPALATGLRVEEILRRMSGESGVADLRDD